MAYGISYEEKETIKKLFKALQWTEHLNDGNNKFYCLRCCEEKPNHTEICPAMIALREGKYLIDSL